MSAFNVNVDAGTVLIGGAVVIVGAVLYFKGKEILAAADPVKLAKDAASTVGVDSGGSLWTNIWNLYHHEDGSLKLWFMPQKSIQQTWEENKR